MRLEGIVAIVTGAASGIGRAIAQRFDAEGAELTLTDVDADGLEETRASLGRPAEVAVADVTDAEAVDALIGSAVDRFGRLDVLSHNAGLDQPVMQATEIGDALWQRLLTTNASGTFFTNRAALRAMLGGEGGSIVNTVSDLGWVVVPGLAAYCASKGAALQLTRALAAEAAPSVRVNAICPTMVDTPMARRSVASRPDPEAYLAEIAAEIPMKRIANVDDVVGAAVFLASSESSYITGIALPIDGGRTVV
ncbi:MAG TPA: SDR family oxidoreductase [Gaiellaceae bacterium]|nr:SDR family oxidoreductase [Gaiellaceae bacterium]